MILELLQKPLIQMLVLITLTIITVIGIEPKNANHTWTIAGCFYIAFIVLNSILICMVSNHWSYFFYSIGFSILYILSIGMIISAYIKIANIEGSGESAMIFLFIIYHHVALLLILLVKWAYFKIF